MQLAKNIRRASTTVAAASLLLIGNVAAQTAIQLTTTGRLDQSPLLAKSKYAGSPQLEIYGANNFFMVGDLYAASSRNHGRTWTYSDPQRVFPTAKPFLSGGRLVQPRKAPKTLIWVLAERPTSIRSTNVMRLAWINKRNDLWKMQWKSITFSSTTLGGRSDQSVRIRDAAADDFWLYVSFDFWSGGFMQQSGIARFSLTNIAADKPIAWQRKHSTQLKGFRYGLARGCTTHMFFASRLNDTKLRIFRWAATGGSFFGGDRTVTRSYSGVSSSKLRNGKSWLNNDEHAITTGYTRGKEIGFLFGSNKGGSFKQPFIRICRFRVSDLSHIGDNNLSDRNHAKAFPAVCVDKDGNIGATWSSGGSVLWPSVEVGILDATNNYSWSSITKKVAYYGNNSPAFARWGYRASVVPHPSYKGNFVATGQTMLGGSTDAYCQHRAVWFSRGNKKPTPFNVNVTSSPIGAPIQLLSGPDANGNRGGNAPIVFRVYRNEPYTLEAPGAIDAGGGQYWVFDRWKFGNGLQPVGKRTLALETIGGTHNCTALYKQGYRLRLRSLHANSAKFTIDKTDANGFRDGTTQQYRFYAKDENVTVTFNRQAGARRFYHLVVNNASRIRNENKLTLKMDRNHDMISVYGFYTGYSTARYGRVCSGSKGVPVHAMSGSPEIGNTVMHKLGNAPANTFVFALAGFSKTTWNGVPLPFKFPGTNCDISVAPDIIRAVVTNSAGVATISATIPHRTRILGLRYYGQFLIADRGATGGAITTQAYDVKIGGYELR